MSKIMLEIPQGKLKGRQCTNYENNAYYSYQGIPYAKPPVGDLRFKLAQPAEPWSGVLDCTKERSESINKNFFFNTIAGTEDCLYVNVYSPEGGKVSKPVMVWIHGGGFTMGSGNTDMYGPDYLMTGDVVLVTFNYRLGVLGFLSLEDPSLGVPGNNGLKDMTLALKWVQKNISHFNGDPGNVTIFGESAGAAAVHLLMLSPMAKGLFHKGILQSGCAINPWVFGSRNAKYIAKAMKFESEDEKEILEMLKKAPEDKIIQGQLVYSDFHGSNSVRPFSFVVEKPSAIEPNLITEEPLDIIMSGNYNKVPIIIGYTNREGIMSYDFFTKTLKLDELLEKCIPVYYKVPPNSTMSKEIATKLKECYFPGPEPSTEMKDSVYQLETDTWFYRGIYVSLKHHLKHSKNPTYFYRFSFDGKLNIFKMFRSITDAPGASHCDDLGYLFKPALLPVCEKGCREEKTIQSMVKLWTNFAKSGDPNTPEEISDLKKAWKPTTVDNLEFIDIGDSLVHNTKPELERMKCWDAISKICTTGNNY